MIIHELQQGSPEWHAHRATHYNASDAAAMLGESPHETRSALIERLATGIAPLVTPQMQARFDRGHRAEAAARPMAERIIGEDLYPIVGSEGRLSASFDGLNMDGTTGWEHKLLNAALREKMSVDARLALANGLPLYYRIQMEQQCLVGGLDRILFQATEWNDDFTECTDSRSTWYTPDPALRQRIIAGWAQLERDVAAYVPTEKAAPVVAAPMETLPAVSVRVDGQLAIVSNLPAFGQALRDFIERIPAAPSTDQEFADVDAACKSLKLAEDALEAAESNALAQLADVDTLRRFVADYRALARATRLQREKLVTQRKDEIRREIAAAAAQSVRDHAAALTLPRGASVSAPASLVSEIAEAMKGKRTIDTLRDAASFVAASQKAMLSLLAERFNSNAATMASEDAADLLPDFAAVGNKAPDDFAALIQLRKHQRAAADAARAEREQEAAPAPLVQAQAPAAQPAEPATMTLVAVSQRLGFTVTADFLETLGFAATRERSSRLYRPSDWPRICDAIARHVIAARDA